MKLPTFPARGTGTEEKQEEDLLGGLCRPVRRLAKNRTHQVYRLKDGTRVPGASTVAKIGSDPSALLNWAWECGCKGLDYRKVRDTAADIGTICHFLIECYLTGCDADLSEFAEADIAKAKISFGKFEEWWSQRELTIITPEEQLVSETYRFGGTQDAPCHDHKGRRVLLDWKTSKAIWDEHLIQLSAYEQLQNENHEDDPVTRRAIIRIGKKESGDFEVRWLSEMDRYFDVFRAQLQLYRAKQGLKQ